MKTSITLPKDDADQLLENSPSALDYQDVLRQAIAIKFEIDGTVKVTLKRDRKAE